MNPKIKNELENLVTIMRQFSVECETEAAAAESQWWEGRQQGAAASYKLAAKWLEEILETVKN